MTYKPPMNRKELKAYLAERSDPITKEFLSKQMDILLRAIIFLGQLLSPQANLYGMREFLNDTENSRQEAFRKEPMNLDIKEILYNELVNLFPMEKAQQDSIKQYGLNAYGQGKEEGYTQAIEDVLGRIESLKPFAYTKPESTVHNEACDRQSVQNWQPIAECDKKGLFDLWSQPNYEIYKDISYARFTDCWWTEGGWSHDPEDKCNTLAITSSITHFMRRPKPPKGEA